MDGVNPLHLHPFNIGGHLKPKYLGLCKNILYQMSVYIGKAISSSLMLKDQPLVINPQLIEKGSLKIMYMDRVFYNVIAEGIGLSIHHSRFYAPPGHPHAKTPWMMVPAVVILR